MATQSPFSLVSDALTQFVSNTQPPAWLMDESINRLVLLLNHVIAQEPEAQNRLKRQKGRCIQLQWQDKVVQLAPTPAGLLERVTDLKFDLKLTLTDHSPLSMASAILKGEKPGVHIEGDVQLAAEVNWLFDHVRWDPEEDVARLIGDAPAHTLVQTAKRIVDALRSFVQQQTAKAAP